MQDTARDSLFISAVEAIYEAAPDPSSWPVALQAIADVLGDVGAVLLWLRADGSVGTIVSESLKAAQEEYEERWCHNDVRNMRGFERGVFTRLDAVTDRDVVTPEEIETHPIYTQFLVPHGLGWFAAAAISPDPLVYVWISIQRAKAKPPYSVGELEVLERLARHAEKSLRLSIRLLEAESTRIGLGEALARIGIGVFILDSRQRVLYLNPAAESLCGAEISIAQGRLRIGFGSERKAIDAAISRALALELEGYVTDAEPILVKRGSSERPFVVYLLPLSKAGKSHEQFLTHARAIVLVIRLAAGEPLDPTLIRDVLGLTLGEARVAALVGSGMPPSEAAARLGIKDETARTTLKRAFSKLGVSRQSELTALLSRLILR